ncbi:carboxylesterase [Panaeolus papilionaceus]|nr:carboxylesterase [Panaeolus papilionaceus]
MRSLLFFVQLLSYSALVLSVLPPTPKAAPPPPPPPAPPASGLTVQTQQGPVAGTSSAQGVRQFLGIPFATAARWQAPQKPAQRTKPLQATQFGDTCVQSLNAGNVEFLKLAGGAGLNLTESESCLNVNVWAPTGQRAKKGTAVLVWIYGGGFQFGSSAVTVYDGTNFVRDNDDITIVSINYRLNIFGQPNAPQLAGSTTSQNFGLLDIEAGIQWVHDNIAAFGGDPNRISLFGQSAGAVAIDAYTFSHVGDTIVKGVIEESGNLGLSATGGLDATLNATNWNAIANAVGCGTNTNAAQLTCMKAVPFRTLGDAVIKSNLSFNLVADNITIFTDTATRAANGNFLKVPVLGGTAANEGDIFVVAQQLLTTGFTIPTVTEILADIQTQLAFTCNAGLTATQRTAAKINTWRYQYQPVFPDISSRPDLRAYHAAEIPIVFGTYNQSTIAAPTATEIALSKYVQGAWVAFARDPVNGLSNLGWPTYNPSFASMSLVQLGNPANVTGFTLGSGALLDASCVAAPMMAQFSANLVTTLANSFAAQSPSN